MSKYIDQSEIIRLTDSGLDVFRHYFPDVDFHNTKHKFKLRDKEKTASANVKYIQSCACPIRPTQ